MNEIAAVIERLKTLPIYPIFLKCSEKDNLTALQFMCIVGFHTNGRKLYTRIEETKQPKLLGQLLQFRQFEKFKYFHYRVNKQYGSGILQCKYCELVGPCGSILSHMTISHNVHTGVKKCVFCEKEKLETHIANNTLAQCYGDYKNRKCIQIIDGNVCNIVADFYEMMRKLCENLNICSTRKKDYAGQGYGCKEKLLHNYGGDISSECEVRYMIQRKGRNRSIRSEALTREFRRIMDISVGGNYGNYAPHSSEEYENVIVIDDNECSDDDDGVNNMTNNSALDSSQYCDTGNGHQYQDLQDAAHTSTVEISNDEMIPENLVKREPIFNHSQTPNVSSYAMPMAYSSTPIERRLSRLSTFSSMSQPSNEWSPRNASEEFAWNIARKLEKIPQQKRRQLEIDIEMTILQTEKESIGEY